jgi:xylulokinase
MLGYTAKGLHAARLDTSRQVARAGLAYERLDQLPMEHSGQRHARSMTSSWASTSARRHEGILLDAEQQRIVARAAQPYGLIEGLPPGTAEQHPDTWIDAITRVCAQLLATSRIERARIAAVGVSGQQHGLVALDEDGRVVRPAKLWCDTSTADEARELSDLFGASVPTGFTASKILWLARNEPESWARTRHVLLPHDYVNYRLTGRYTMEAGDASGTGFFDPLRRSFAQVRAGMIDERLPGLLPPLLDAGEPAGRIDARGARWSGLPEGALVSAGGGDNMMSAIGSGATRPGVVVVSLGTSGTVFTHSERPVIDPEGLIAPFCASVGGWLPLLCVMNCTGVTEEVRALTGLSHAELTEQASLVPPGCDGLLWLPYLSGERVPDLPDATGTCSAYATDIFVPASSTAPPSGRPELRYLAWGVSRIARPLGASGRGSPRHLQTRARRAICWRAVYQHTLDALRSPVPRRAGSGARRGAASPLRRCAAPEGGRRGPHGPPRPDSSPPARRRGRGRSHSAGRSMLRRWRRFRARVDALTLARPGDPEGRVSP